MTGGKLALRPIADQRMHTMQDDRVMRLTQIALAFVTRGVDIDDSLEYVKDSQSRHCAATPLASSVKQNVFRSSETVLTEPTKNPVPVQQRHITHLQVKEGVSHEKTESIVKEEASCGYKRPRAGKEY